MTPHTTTHLGIKVGLGVGVPVGTAIAFTCICIILFRRSSRRQTTREEQEGTQVDDDNDNTWREQPLIGSTQVLELGAVSRSDSRAELPSDEKLLRPELPGRKRER